MKEQLIRSLREERDQLRAELQADPRHRQIEMIDALLASYGSSTGDQRGAEMKLPSRTAESTGKRVKANGPPTPTARE